MTVPKGALVVRAVGAVALTLALAWFAGGQQALGRIDPALALPLLPVPALLLAWSLRQATRRMRRRSIGLTLALLVAAQALLAMLLSDRAPWLQLALVGLGWAVVAPAADRLLQWRGGRIQAALLALALVAGGFAASHALLAALYRAPPAAGPPVTMLTGLPLRWSGGSDIAAMIAEGTSEDPALRRLDGAGPIRLVDSLVDNPPPPGGALLLAHPRALAPRELVAIDAFVRDGGRAVLLADALTDWPVRHPIGDPRNPPVTSLLTPLLDHWGATLGAAANGETRAVEVEGARLVLFSSGRFERSPSGCASFGERRVIRCHIGRGEAWLVGDADLLFAPLWQPPQPWASHLRRADTIEWLAARLWPDAPRARLQPLWIRAAAE